MTWIQTYTGKRVDIFDFKEDMINIEDIAHSLSFICRFNGHCSQFYSVGEHSYRISKWLENSNLDVSKADFIPEHLTKLKDIKTYLQFWGLMHDSGESYVSDLAKPIKQEMPIFKEIENNITQIISNKFDLKLPMPSIIKFADLVFLRAEQKSLMGSEKHHKWNLSDKVRNAAKDIDIKPFSPRRSKIMFLKQYEKLIKEWGKINDKTY